MHIIKADHLDRDHLTTCLVQPNTAQYSPVQPCTVQHCLVDPVQFSTAQYSLVQTSTAQFTQIQLSTTQYSPVEASTAPYGPVQPCRAQSSPVADKYIPVQLSTARHQRRHTHYPIFPFRNCIVYLFSKHFKQYWRGFRAVFVILKHLHSNLFI